MSRPLINLEGQVFGRLLVTARADDYVSPKGQHAPRWHALCECGNATVAMGQKLRNGRAKSCGCLGREGASETVPAAWLGEMTQEQMIVKPQKDPDGWLRMPVFVTVDGVELKAIAEYRQPSEGPVVKTYDGSVIPEYRITRVRHEDSVMRERHEDLAKFWPPRMPGAMPAGMHNGYRQGG